MVLANFFSRIGKKLNNKKGESLVEVLVTILLVGLVSAGFLVVVETANNMSKRAAEIDGTFYEDISNAEAGLSAEGGSTAEFKISLTKPDSTQIGDINISVNKIQGNNGIVSYKLPEDLKPKLKTNSPEDTPAPEEND